MVYTKPLNILVVLALLSFAKGFALRGDWRLKKVTGDTTTNSFPNTLSGGASNMHSDDGTIINSFLGCNSISLNNAGFSLTADASSDISAGEYTFGFWVNFESTISDKVFQFGTDAGIHYKVSSTVNGSLKVSYFSDATTTDSANDFSFTVPLSNSYTDKYFFLVFHFKDNTSAYTIEIMLPGTDKISKTSATFGMPGGNFFFGKGIKGKFHRVILTKTATINLSFDTITLDDGSFTSNDYASPCTPGTCIDSACILDIIGNPNCVSLMDYCTECNVSGCTTCNPDSARASGGWCQSCIAEGTTNELKNYHCNFYLGCAKANNCAECSKKSTQCDACATSYFLYDDSATSTTSCLSCANSCTNCALSSACYTCAEAITQTGTTCRVDFVGYKVSINLPNIVFDFPHPLSTGLSKNSLKATSNSGVNIDTSNWDMIGCVAGLIQCKILVSNLAESDLPIALEFGFTQV